MIVGVLGAGQLGRMLALSGIPMGMQFRFLSTSPDACAADVGELVVGSAFDDEAAIGQVARGGGGCDVVTYEFENIPARAIEIAARYAPVYPGALALTLAQDRVDEKNFFRSIGEGDIATPDFRAVSSRNELDAAASALGYPFVLKTRRFGYDGKGQRIIKSSEELDGAWGALGAHPGGLIAEQFVRFARELSVLGVRGRDGGTAVYPITENVHEGGILRTSIAPAPDLTPELRDRARDIVIRAMHEMDYIGVLAIELFEVVGEGERTLLVNEMACRVHNSGHWTMDASITSQFENHLRAVTGLPLGDTGMRPGVTHAGMVNLISDHPPLARLLGQDRQRVHLYGKAPKPGRKLGHLNFPTGDEEALRESMSRAETLIRRA